MYYTVLGLISKFISYTVIYMAYICKFITSCGW